jgi:hypothetical protein
VLYFIALLAVVLHAEGIVSMHIVYDYTNQNSAVRSPTRAAGCLRTQLKKKKKFFFFTLRRSAVAFGCSVTQRELTLSTSPLAKI